VSTRSQHPKDKRAASKKERSRKVPFVRILLADDHKIVRDGYLEAINRRGASSFTLLTSREREVLQLLAEGKSSKEIAFSFNLSVKTIEAHRQRIMQKLKIRNIASLTKYAIREGLTSEED
jgi:DNA-binding CsgD family transcriptional regulator